MNDRAFSCLVFRYFCAFTLYELFVSFRSEVKNHYCTILATATGNCDVTNVTYNENTYYIVT